MENQAVEKAKALLRRYPGLSFPVDMEKLVALEGCELIEWPFLFPVTEVKHGRWIGVAKGLSPIEIRHLAAHALGHREAAAGRRTLDPILHPLPGSSRPGRRECFSRASSGYS